MFKSLWKKVHIRTCLSSSNCEIKIIISQRFQSKCSLLLSVFSKEMLKMSSHRQFYTLLMVVDQNRHGDQKAVGHCDIQPTGFSVSPPPPSSSIPSKNSNGEAPPEKSIFPVRQWIGCSWRGGLWEGRAPRL